MNKHPAAVDTRRPVALTGLSFFFWFGATMATVAAVTLLFPRTALSAVWRVNPVGYAGLRALGLWSVLLMTVVSAACAAAGIGLWTGQRWGRHVALAVLVVNLVGDVANAVVRGDARTLIGIPFGGALIAYLFSRQARSFVRAR